MDEVDEVIYHNIGKNIKNKKNINFEIELKIL